MRTTFKTALMGAVALSLTACSSGTQQAAKNPVVNPEIEHPLDTVRVSVGDFGDAATTAAGLWSGVAAEANPIMAPFGDAVPVVAFPVKLGFKHGLVKLGTTPARANVSVNMGSWVGTCANLLTLAGAAPQVAIPFGIGCALIYREEATKEYEATTGRTIDGEPVDN